MSVLFYILLSFVQLTRQVCGAGEYSLGDFIKRYETLNYVATEKLYRRDTERLDRTRFLEFDAYGRKFKLALVSDFQTIAPDAEILDGQGKRINFNKRSLVFGQVVSEPDSIVHGFLRDDGVFIGKIHSKNDVYVIESGNRYFKSPTTFHSVIYKEEDLNFDVKFPEPKIASSVDGLNEDSSEFAEKFKRSRRATGDIKYNKCRLSLEADYTFLNFAKGSILAVGEMLRHVQALNIIYGQAFNTSTTYSPYSLLFHVGRLQVYNESQTPVGLRRENIDSSTFLSIMSEKDYSKFCEAVYFTHRNFAGGILGLAWIGYPQGRAGGICDPRRGLNSYNTAVVTFTLQGKTSPPKISEITFAHEIGHAFGAQHDNDECSPGGENGNYIMYSKATSGDRKRNDRFSPCSISQIMENVNAKRGKVIDKSTRIPRLCLENDQRMIERGDLCQNGVIDEGEECDCGHKSQCEQLEPNSCCNWQTCKLNPGKQCSPSQGPCCNVTCQTASKEQICEYGSDCLQDSKCLSSEERKASNVQGYDCPPQSHRQDDTKCQGGAMLCYKGMCSKSICVSHGLKPCECKKREEECHACCIKDDICQSAYKIDEMKRSTPYNYSIGYPCGNNTGYCDFFQYCQKVDLEGPLLQLYNLYFTAEGIAELTRKYWWAIMLGVLGLIAIIVLLIIYGARYTETDNPDGRPAKPLPNYCMCSSDVNRGEDYRDRGDDSS